VLVHVPILLLEIRANNLLTRSYQV
jgi:hypothetical protein